MFNSDFSVDKQFSQSDFRTHTQFPTTTGTSVIGIKFNEGVIIAGDILGSYGSLARYRNVERIFKVNKRTVAGCSGDIADFQLVKSIVEDRVIEEELLDDGFSFSPRGLHTWLTRVLYNRRSKFDPLWNTYVVAGIEEDGVPYLGYTNMIGVAFTGDCIATGFGGFLALPMLRDVLEKKGGAESLTKEDAIVAIKNCLSTLFYRDCRAFASYQLAVATVSDVEVLNDQKLETKWDLAQYVRGYE